MTADGVCALCLRSAELRRSHVLPEFLYAPVYDEKHRFWQVSTDPSRRKVSRPTGLYERLLCADCEQKLSRWETYADQVLNGGVELQGEKTSFGIVLHGVDYSHFKLFALSLLWRAGVSQREEFAAVALHSHQEVLRRMLDEERAGRYWEYGFAVVFPC